MHWMFCVRSTEPRLQTVRLRYESAKLLTHTGGAVMSMPVQEFFSPDAKGTQPAVPSALVPHFMSNWHASMRETEPEALRHWLSSVPLFWKPPGTFDSESSTPSPMVVV